MKKHFVFLIVFSLSLNVRAQKCVISNPKENILYVGLSNVLEVAVSGYKCSDFLLVTNNGKIEPTDDICSYYITPENTGIAVISVLLKHSKKNIGTTKIRVRNIPSPVAFIASKTGGEIPKNVFKVQVGIFADILNMDIEAHVIVTGFNMTIFRDNQLITTKYCKSNSFSDEIKEAMSHIEVGDRVLFSNITYKGIANNGYLQPIEFRIID